MFRTGSGGGEMRGATGTDPFVSPRTGVPESRPLDASLRGAGLSAAAPVCARHLSCMKGVRTDAAAAAMRARSLNLVPKLGLTTH